jgi:predicted kinase
MNSLVGAELVLAGCRLAMHGHAAVLDATFLDATDRRRTERAIAATGVPFIGIWLHAPLAELESRIAARTGDASDATLAVLRRAARTDSAPSDWLKVDARNSTAALAAVRRAVLCGPVPASAD